MSDERATIEDFLLEERTFAPPQAAQDRSLWIADGIDAAATAGSEAFWAGQAQRLLTWQKPFTQTLDWQLPNARWFADGTLNVAQNCLDRHVDAGFGDRVAYHWEGEPGDTRTITYAQLRDEVAKFANVLKRLGVQRGDRVAVYLPMIPELPVTMLACARIGAVHSVVFGGFSADALADRINDSDCKVLVTADGGWRRGKPALLKPAADDALTKTTTITDVVVVQRTGASGDDTPIPMTQGRDHWYHDVMAEASTDCPCEEMGAEDLLYLLYTSGTTAKPKGVMHTTGGYLTQIAFTHKYVFDVHPDDVYWCAADVGWVTGHSYIVYGPLANGVTSVMYEGTPDTPAKDRFWDIIERYKVNVLYTAPTAIRTFMKWGTNEPAKHDLSSLRTLGSVGEPINPEAWIWYNENIGGGSCPIVDTWWQTETGGIMVTPIPGVTTTKPGSATFPLPGIDVELVDEAGQKVERGGGYLTITKPWPSMLRGVWGDPQRFYDTYWSKYPGRYFAGDGAKIDEDGYIWVIGRVDDVMNVSGHRISTTEVESALVDDPRVAEAAVVGATDATTGQAIIAFVTVKGATEWTETLGEELRSHVADKIGKISRPKTVVFTDDLPKTRSGKIMRRLLRDVAEGRDLGDTTTLADPGVVEEIRRRAEGG